MPGRIFHELHALWQARTAPDEYVGTLVNAWLAQGGEAVGVEAGTSYVGIARQHVPAARFIEIDGGPLPFARSRFELVLAVDSFRFLVQTDAIHAQLGEIARVLRPDGRLLVFNWTYGDPADSAAHIADSPLALLRGPERPFLKWDATAFLLAHR